MRHLVWVACVAVLLTGCTMIPYEQLYPEIGATRTTAFPNTKTYSRSFDDVWGAIVAVLGEFQFPFQLVEKESGLITTEWLDMGAYSTRTGSGKSLQVTISDYLSCSVENAGDIPCSTRCKLNFIVTSGDGGTAVRINSHFEGQKSDIDVHLGGSMSTRYYWESCNSMGKLEAALFEKIDEQLS